MQKCLSSAVSVDGSSWSFLAQAAVGAIVADPDARRHYFWQILRENCQAAFPRAACKQEAVPLGLRTSLRSRAFRIYPPS
jgi:hypothetical protein